MTKISENSTSKPSRKRKTTAEKLAEQQQNLIAKSEAMNNLLISTLEYYKEKAILKNKFDSKFYNEVLNYIYSNKN